ncbi:MAG: hydroxyacid dehydrogenase [Actinobacteria bacterium]|nr:hydroxyacid dehydrogenase [Actinomycetota bacterium]
MEGQGPPAITTQPRTAAWIDAAVEAGGGRVVDPSEAVGVVWTDPAAPEGLEALLEAHPGIAWVQLPWAGIEPYRGVVERQRERTWSCAKGVYADPVAEHALALLLAGFRQLPRYARAGTWTGDAGRNLFGARVVILGGGGIAQVLVRLLEPFRCSITVVRRSPEPMAGVERVLAPHQLHEAIRGAEALVLALPLLPETTGLIGAHELALLAPDAWVVNVARGAHIRTDDLVAALEGGRIGGAALDVTDPEPLPDDHPLWSLPNVVITPHTGNTRAMARPLLSARIVENVRRYAAGQDLVGLVDAEAGY